MPALLNPVDFVKVGVMAFAAVWIINRTMKKFGLDQFTA